MSFTLTMLPLLARLIQSVRRYGDSKKYLHLVNVSQCRFNYATTVHKGREMLTRDVLLCPGRKVRKWHHLLLCFISLETPW
jgi:hypothetical protein